MTAAIIPLGLPPRDTATLLSETGQPPGPLWLALLGLVMACQIAAAGLGSDDTGLRLRPPMGRTIVRVSSNSTVKAPQFRRAGGR